jgi:hypothetical protein
LITLCASDTAAEKHFDVNPIFIVSFVRTGEHLVYYYVSFFRNASAVACMDVVAIDAEGVRLYSAIYLAACLCWPVSSIGV